jgi:hypothetical protein
MLLFFLFFPTLQRITLNGKCCGSKGKRNNDLVLIFCVSSSFSLLPHPHQQEGKKLHLLAIKIPLFFDSSKANSFQAASESIRNNE